MMKLKTIAICLMFIGTGVAGAILAAPQADTDRGHARLARGTRPGGTKSQPALHAMESYVVEPPDMTHRRGPRGTARPTDLRRAAGQTRRQDLAGFLRRDLCRRTDTDRDQGEGHPALAEVSQ